MSASFSGFSVTDPTGSQFVTERVPQRDGLFCLPVPAPLCDEPTARYLHWRAVTAA